MMIGVPITVTMESCHDNLNMKTTTPMILTMLRRNTFTFRERVSLMVVVSEVNLEVRSPKRSEVKG